jgi:hypothetical protein
LVFEAQESADSFGSYSFVTHNHTGSIDGEVMGVYCTGEQTHLLTINDCFSRKILKAIEVSELLNETKQQTMEEKRPDALEMAA